MEVSKNLAKILLYFVPALLVMGGMFLLIKKFLDRDYKLRLIEAKISKHKDVLGLRLQAYERICIFLERISPTSILLRLNKSGMSASQLQTELLQNIRSEFEHNLSQQIYISPRAWEMVKNTKEDIIRLVNTSMTQLDRSSSSIDLSATIFENMMKEEKMPVQKALDFLRAEAKELMV